MPTPSALRTFPAIGREAAKSIVRKWMSGTELTAAEADVLEGFSTQNRVEQLASVYEVHQ